MITYFVKSLLLLDFTCDSLNLFFYLLLLLYFASSMSQLFHQLCKHLETVHYYYNDTATWSLQCKGNNNF